MRPVTLALILAAVVAAVPVRFDVPLRDDAALQTYSAQPIDSIKSKKPLTVVDRPAVNDAEKTVGEGKEGQAMDAEDKDKAIDSNSTWNELHLPGTDDGEDSSSNLPDFDDELIFGEMDSELEDEPSNDQEFEKPVAFDRDSIKSNNAFDKPVAFDRDGDAIKKTDKPVSFDRDGDAIKETDKPVAFDRDGDAIQNSEFSKRVAFDRQTRDAIQNTEFDKPVAFDQDGEEMPSDIASDDDEDFSEMQDGFITQEPDSEDYEFNNQEGDAMDISESDPGFITQEPSEDYDEQSLEFEAPVKFDRNGDAIKAGLNGDFGAPVKFDRNGDAIKAGLDGDFGMPVEFDRNDDASEFDNEGDAMDEDLLESDPGFATQEPSEDYDDEQSVEFDANNDAINGDEFEDASDQIYSDEKPVAFNQSGDRIESENKRVSLRAKSSNGEDFNKLVQFDQEGVANEDSEAFEDAMTGDEPDYGQPIPDHLKRQADAIATQA